MFHSVADGNCYLPLVQDFLMLYDAARGRAASRLPPIAPGFDELQQRLFDTFNCRPSPMRSSLRGGFFQYKKVGYNYTIGLNPGVISLTTRTAVHHRVPLDIAILGIISCAMARADNSEFVDFTLYAPMRDGAATRRMLHDVGPFRTQNPPKTQKNSSYENCSHFWDIFQKKNEKLPL